MLNKATNDFIDALTKLVNESGLPPVNARLAIDVVRMQVFDAERQAVNTEIREAAKKAQEKKDTKAPALIPNKE